MIHQHTFTYRGLSVDVEVDYGTPPKWTVSYIDTDGLLNTYQVNYPVPEGGQIKINFSHTVGRPDGTPLRSKPSHYYEPDLERFYRAKIPPDMEHSHWSGINAVNGLIARLDVFGGNKQTPANGIRVFRADGSVYQPVTFDSAITQPDYDESAVTPAPNGEITLTAVDGVGPFQYSLDGGALQASGTFTDLAPGTYTVRVEDSEGTYREQQISLVNQFELVV